LVVDTAFFRGNFPQKAKVEAINWSGEGEPGALAADWVEIVAASKCSPDKEHEFESQVKDKTFTHVKLVMIPDGGVKRIRVLGKRSE
jgi:allantoicase